MKKCKKCSADKPLAMFNYNKHTIDKLSTWCKSCHLAASLKTSRKTSFTGKYRSYSCTENKRFKDVYNITAQQHHNMLVEQDNSCPICKTRFDNTNNSKYRAVVDHDHNTGVVRQLLCNECNIGLGKFKDDPSLLLVALEYLKKHAHKT